MTALFTRNRAEAWREANRTPVPAQLAPPKAHLSAAIYKLALYLSGAVLLSLIGALM